MPTAPLAVVHALHPYHPAALTGDELYQAAWLMGQLTMHVYETRTDEGDGVRRASDRRTSYPVRGSGLDGVQKQKADVYLLVKGKGRVRAGEKMVRMANDHSEIPLEGARLQILGRMHTVREADEDERTLVLDVPVAQEGEPNNPHPLELDRGEDAEVWLLEECVTEGVNADMQLLLFNLGAHVMALKLLELPFTREHVKPQEIELRAVLRAAYRLLKALCSNFSLIQMSLFPHLHKFVEHAEAKLVSHDISPTDCINAIFKDNGGAAAQVSNPTVTLR